MLVKLRNYRYKKMRIRGNIGCAVERILDCSMYMIFFSRKFSLDFHHPHKFSNSPSLGTTNKIISIECIKCVGAKLCFVYLQVQVPAFS